MTSSIWGIRKILVGILWLAAFWPNLQAAENGESVLRILLEPGPKPPRLATESKPARDELFELDSSYPREADTNGLFQRFDVLEDEVRQIQTRVYATNAFLAKIHNYRAKATQWRRTFEPEVSELRERVEAMSQKNGGETNRVLFQMLCALSIPFSIAEMADDPEMAPLLVESERIKLKPPVPARPPCMYMIDSLLGLPAGEDESLRLPVNPPPTIADIRKELRVRVEKASEIIQQWGPCEAFTPASVRALKAKVLGELLHNMAELSQRVLFPEDLRKKLDEARRVKSQLPRGPLKIPSAR